MNQGRGGLPPYLIDAGRPQDSLANFPGAGGNANCGQDNRQGIAECNLGSSDYQVIGSGVGRRTLPFCPPGFASHPSVTH